MLVRQRPPIPVAPGRRRGRDHARAAAVVALAALVAFGPVADPAFGDDLLVGRLPVATERPGASDGTPPEDAARPAVVRYEAPITGAVRRGFDGPRTAYGAGHRGADLEAPAGTVVVAAGAGAVTHAGEVAGTVWVSVAHADGVVTTYGPLTELTVRRGMPVERGRALGRLAAGGHGLDGADRGLHWGARRHGVYIDPMSLLDAAVPRPSLVGAGGWRATAPVVEPYAPWQGGRWRGWTVAPSPKATAGGYVVPPTPNHLVLVAGLGTASGSSILDPEHLGYDLGDVTRFSYAGRHDGAGETDDPERDQLPYGPEDTWEGVDVAARRLAEQLRAHAARHPGRAVDLVGHSMGGVVIVHYLVHHHDPYDRGVPTIGNVVTIASPLRGADLAGAAQDLRAHSWIGPLGEYGRRRIADGDGPLAEPFGSVSLTAPAIDDLAPHSRTITELEAAWHRALRDGPAGPLAMGTRVLMIGGSRDLVVGAHRTAMPEIPSDRLSLGGGWEEFFERPDPQLAWSDDDLDPFDRRRVERRMLPGGHSSVRETEAVRETVHRFLAGEEVVDSRGRLSHMLGEEFALTYRTVTLGLRLHDLIGAPLRRLLRQPPGPVARPRGN